MAVTQQVILTTTVVAVDIILQQHFVGFDGKVCAAGKAVLGVAETGSNAVAGIALDAATQAGDTVRILRGA
ncbi:hypothetical protein CR628_000436 [Escherichia coli]|nr:hypothetical protein [Escherichia coli]